MAQRLPRFDAELERVADLRKIGKIIEETGEVPAMKLTAGATAAGDSTRLRGIPAIGRGCQGAIRGTRQGENLGA